MEQEKKTTSGAPSSDTTSALFVSARKKQLEQQEEERRAKEKEDERLAAEAEVRRLEAEVEDRRRKAEEEARRVEREAAEKRRQAEEEARRIAEEARAKMAQAAENPDAVLGAAPQKKELKLPQMPKMPKMPAKKESGAREAAPVTVKEAESAAPAKAKGRKKTFILGALAGAVLLVVLVVALAMMGGSDELEEPEAPAFEIYGSYYLDGDVSQREFNFDSDGEFYMNSPEATLSGEWYAADDQIYLTTDEESVTGRILDNDTLDFGENGTFLRVTGDMTWYPDGDAEFDSTVAATTMALGVAYPSSQFYIEEQTADGFTLKSMDDQAYINYNQLRQGSTWTHQEMSAVADALLTAMVDSLPDAVILDNVYDESRSMGYFALNYQLDGETRYQYVSIQGWNNLTDGSKWYYAGLVDCPDSQSDVYSALFSKVHESRFDT